MGRRRQSRQLPPKERVGLTQRQYRILAYLRDELTYREIASRLDVGYETIKKDIQALYRALGVHHRRKAVTRAYELGLLRDGAVETGLSRSHPSQALLVFVLLIVLGTPVAIYSRIRTRSDQPCDAFSDLTQVHWTGMTASYDVTPGSAMTIQEADPDSYFGKVESEVLTVDTTACPTLHIHVSQLDANAGYAVQILDKTTVGTSAVEVLSQDRPGSQVIDLPSAMGWTGGGTRLFTINLWVSGEGKSFTIDRLYLERK